MHLNHGVPIVTTHDSVTHHLCVPHIATSNNILSTPFPLALATYRKISEILEINYVVEVILFIFTIRHVALRLCWNYVSLGQYETYETQCTTFNPPSKMTLKNFGDLFDNLNGNEPDESDAPDSDSDLESNDTGTDFGDEQNPGLGMSTLAVEKKGAR